MAQHDSRILSSHPEAYSRSFQCFLASTNQENAILKCIEKHIAPVINKRISDIQEVRASNKSPYRVLSVGSGEGENDISILKTLNDKIPLAVGESLSLFNRVIEPDVDRLASFRTKAVNLAEHFRRPANIDFEWIPMTFEEYTSQKKADDVKFNVVHFIHSIYYVRIEDALVHCYEKELGRKGVIISIAQHEASPIRKLPDEFSDQHVALYPSNGDVIAVAITRGWKYFVCPGDFKSLDVTAIFDWSSHEGGYLLDFLTARIDVRQSEEKATVEEILKFWQDQSFINEHGRRIVTLRDNAVIILKGFDH